jgi:hypothetical protein
MSIGPASGSSDLDDWQYEHPGAVGVDPGVGDGIRGEGTYPEAPVADGFRELVAQSGFLTGGIGVNGQTLTAF